MTTPPTTTTTATRTYLEMRERENLRPARVPDESLTIERDDTKSPSLCRWLYAEVGRDYRWTDRMAWTDADAAAYLNDPNVELWLLKERGETAGYFELRRDAEGNVEIVYFGLLPGFTGRRLGGHFLTEAIERAWAFDARRVWLHTCTFDHPGAIPNYVRRGFTVFRTEEYLVTP